MSFDEIQYYGTSKAYENRWSKVQEERSSLYADLLEAEALWGTELKDQFDVLFSLEHELMNYIRNYLKLTNPKTTNVEKASMEKHLSKKRDVMYDDLSDSDEDEFRTEFKAGVASIELYLKPKLVHAAV